MELTYLMLGSNMGDRLQYLGQCVRMLERGAGRVVALSSVYESEPWGFSDPCLFLNRAVAVETDLAPHALLECIHRVEQSLGRVRVHGHSGYLSRTADIDIILYGNMTVSTAGLTVPHPRMTERMFVMQPVAELAPDLMHPVLHRTMAYLRDHCVDTTRVVRLEV